MQNFGSEFGARNPSSCVGIALLCILVGLTPWELDSRPLSCPVPDLAGPDPQTTPPEPDPSGVWHVFGAPYEGPSVNKSPGVNKPPPGRPRGAPRKTGSATSILKRSLARFARKFFGPN
jgi:hypothetical protein